MEQRENHETRTYRVNRFLIEPSNAMGKACNLLKVRELECRGARIQIPAGVPLSLFPIAHIMWSQCRGQPCRRGKRRRGLTQVPSVLSTNVRPHFIEEKAWMGSPTDSVADWGFLHSCCVMDEIQK